MPSPASEEETSAPSPRAQESVPAQTGSREEPGTNPSSAGQKLGEEEKKKNEILGDAAPAPEGETLFQFEESDLEQAIREAELHLGPLMEYM